MSKPRVVLILLFSLVLLFKMLSVAKNKIPERQPYWSPALLGPLLLYLMLKNAA